jgi:hypothetical protein
MVKTLLLLVAVVAAVETFERYNKIIVPDMSII